MGSFPVSQALYMEPYLTLGDCGKFEWSIRLMIGGVLMITLFESEEPKSDIQTIAHVLSEHRVSSGAQVGSNITVRTTLAYREALF